MTTERSDISIPIYTVDSFSTEPFRGNPAAVCLVPRGRVSDGVYVFSISIHIE